MLKKPVCTKNQDLIWTGGLIVSYGREMVKFLPRMNITAKFPRGCVRTMDTIRYDERTGSVPNLEFFFGCQSVVNVRSPRFFFFFCP